MPSRTTSEEELRQLHKEEGGSITAVAKRLRMPYGTVRSRYDRIGLLGLGQGGNSSKAPPDDELRRLYEKFGGHVGAISQHLDVAPSSVSKWIAALGLEGQGKHSFGRVYPREIQHRIKDGHAVVFSDAHFWEREKTPAHSALIEVIKKLKPSVVIANGDVLDGARISRHDPSGIDETPTFSDELHVCREHMAEIKRVSKGAETFWAVGNHCARLSKYIARNAPELLDTTPRLDHYFLGWRFCWSIRLSDLLVMHRFRGGQHATFTNVLRSGMNIATGHLHSQRVYPFTDARGTRYGIDLGCLADPMGPQFAYAEAAPLDWRSGFATFEFKNGRMLPPQLVTVLDDGSVYWQRNERVV